MKPLFQLTLHYNIRLYSKGKEITLHIQKDSLLKEKTFQDQKNFHLIYYQRQH